ncbi:MAG: TatD family hydrolase [candidate division WOR-3 bacterium]|nr:TatD family hydrolase [candidate division WOR-3 bacterium]MDH5682895.1 TatD family hydrolase [candidate division WOR-3 bacterium]
MVSSKSNVILFDSHCHLTDRAYSLNLKEVINRAKDTGVKYLLTAGLNRSDSKNSLKLCHEFDSIYCSIGVHPHDADKFSESELTEFKILSKDNRVKAIGETGLDFFRNYSKPENQERAFRAQIDLAKELNLPMVIHIRDAYPQTMKILKENGYFKGVLHCYSGDEAFAQEAIKLGFYISISGSITYDGNKLKSVIKQMPLDRLMIETDAPYLAPVPNRGKRNEPAFVRYTLQTIAQILNKDFSSLAQITTDNAKRCFGIQD